MKRSRQRVDAGEPRNTYSSIPTYATVPGKINNNFMSSGSPPLFSPAFLNSPQGVNPRDTAQNEQLAKALQTMYGGQTAPTLPGSNEGMTPEFLRHAYENFLSNMASYMGTTSHVPPMNIPSSEPQDKPDSQECSIPDTDKTGDANEVPEARILENHAALVEALNNGTGATEAAGDSHQAPTTIEKSTNEGEGSPKADPDQKAGCDSPGSRSFSRATNADENEEDSSSKRARVENIITHLQGSGESPKKSSEPVSQGGSPAPTSENMESERNSSRADTITTSRATTPKSKRKQYQPQQWESASLEMTENAEESDELKEGSVKRDAGESITTNGDVEDGLFGEDEDFMDTKDSELIINEGVEDIDAKLQSVQSQCLELQRTYMALWAEKQQSESLKGLEDDEVEHKGDHLERPEESETPPLCQAPLATLPNHNGGVLSDCINPDRKFELDAKVVTVLKSQLLTSISGAIDKFLESLQGVDSAPKKLDYKPLDRGTKIASESIENGKNSSASKSLQAQARKKAVGLPNGDHGTGSTSFPLESSVSVPSTNVSEGQPSSTTWPIMPNTLSRPHPFYLNPSLYYNAALNYAASMNNLGGTTGGALHGATGGIFPPFANSSVSSVGTRTSQSYPCFSNLTNSTGVNALKLTSTPKQEDALSLVMPKKKRSKVTDTRISRVNMNKSDSESSAPQLNHLFYAPTMVPQQPPQHPQMLLARSASHSMFGEDKDDDSLSNSDGGSEMASFDSGLPGGHSSTLTPMHLRKAKLMFFFTRYPSSSLLKAYFPDIKFNKNNTAQLVKWFSNFREFYYIQMEKYARQALAEGVRSADDVYVTTESELYRVLNLHYNRNNHIVVPPNFCVVVQATLREFFKSIQSSRDSEPSWKKAIYKIIQRLDDPIPEHFKNPMFLDQLDG